MKMSDIIGKVSELYRKEHHVEKEIRHELSKVLQELMNTDYTKGENITLARYNHLTDQRKYLEDKLNSQCQYLAGISVVRELLMDLGFDTEVT